MNEILITYGAESKTDCLLISGYRRLATFGKLKNVEWYIQLLRVESKKYIYIVLHSLSELESIRSRLRAYYEQIMHVELKNPIDHSFINIKYRDFIRDNYLSYVL